MKKILCAAVLQFSALIYGNAQSVKVDDVYVQQKLVTAKMYVGLLLMEGPKHISDKAASDKLQMEHVKYIFTLKEEGKLATAGPVYGDKELHGFGIFNTSDMDEVKKLLENDPAIKRGHFAYKLYQYMSFPGDMLK